MHSGPTNTGSENTELVVDLTQPPSQPGTSDSAAGGLVNTTAQLASDFEMGDTGKTSFCDKTKGEKQ